MSGHTPGPWLLTSHTVYALDEVGETNRFSCNMQAGYSYYGRTVKERVSNDELTANARLIAAAPELKGVAQKALEFAVLTLAFHGRDRGTDRQERMLDDLEKLALELDADSRAAIAKATGGK